MFSTVFWVQLYRAAKKLMWDVHPDRGAPTRGQDPGSAQTGSAQTGSADAGPAPPPAFKFQKKLVSAKYRRSGSSGTVFAYSGDSVVKVISRAAADDSAELHREIRLSVENEVAHCRRLGALGLAPEFRGFDCDGSNYFLVSERFDDDVMGLLWTARRPEDLEFMSQVVSLLRTAVYDHGVYCYDVKPSNVVFRRRGLALEFRLVDLESCTAESKFTGIAKAHAVAVADLQFLHNMTLLFALTRARNQALTDHLVAAHFTRDPVVRAFAARSDTAAILEKIRAADFFFSGYMDKFEPDIARITAVLTSGDADQGCNPAQAAALT